MITVEIDEESANEVTTEVLHKLLKLFTNNLQKLLETENVIGVFSFDIDEEIFALVNKIQSIETTLRLFGYNITDNYINLLNEHNKEIYKAVYNFNELQVQKEEYVKKANILNEELQELRNKVNNLVT